MHRLVVCGEGGDLEPNSCEARHDTAHRPWTGSPGVAALSLLYILASLETSGGSMFMAHVVLFYDHLLQGFIGYRLRRLQASR